jgi:hypothetical protein
MKFLNFILVSLFSLRLFSGVMCSCLKPRSKPYEFQTKWVTDQNGVLRVMQPQQASSHQLQQAVFYVNAEARVQAMANQKDANNRANYARRLSSGARGSNGKVRAWLEN